MTRVLLKIYNMHIHGSAYLIYAIKFHSLLFNIFVCILFSFYIVFLYPFYIKMHFGRLENETFAHQLLALKL